MFIVTKVQMTNKIDYLTKLKDNISPILEGVSKPQLLELGVRHGISTKFFLEYCEKNDGNLISVDIDDYSNVSKSKNWKFVHSRDDNYKKVIENQKTKFDLIYIDSFHNAKHVSKIIYLYFNNLKENGHIFVDDISWVLYTKDNVRDNFNSEINNYETFYEILNILNTNMNIISVSFDFTLSGLCKIKKISNSELIKSKKIKLRNFSIKNFFRKFLRK
jgi:predicted O-methyltransferase YrrM